MNDISCMFPDNPFKIKRPKHALHEIDALRGPLLDKEELTAEDKLLLYRLRIDELLWLLDDSAAHLDWAESDYRRLAARVTALTGAET